MAELVDAFDSKSNFHGSAGSSPARGTIAAEPAIGVGKLLAPDTWATRNIVYSLEAVALMAFGLSWMTQGRVAVRLLADSRDLSDERIAQAAEAM